MIAGKRNKLTDTQIKERRQRIATLKARRDEITAQMKPLQEERQKITREINIQESVLIRSING